MYCAGMSEVERVIIYSMRESKKKGKVSRETEKRGAHILVVHLVCIYIFTGLFCNTREFLWCSNFNNFVSKRGSWELIFLLLEFMYKRKL